MTNTSTRLLTASDLAVLPELLPSGSVRYELDDGRLVVFPPLTDRHARSHGKVLRHLSESAEDRGLGVALGRVGIILRRNPDRVVAPDAAFILTRSLPPKPMADDYLETVPELIVEVREPSERTVDVAVRAEEYFAAGALVVWDIDPQAHTVADRRPDGSVTVSRETDTLTCDLLPGFAVPVAKLFAGS
jgi:Uma2 family endonuclease